MAFFATAIQQAVRSFDAELAVAGGVARFGNDDGYGCGPPEVVYPALARFETTLREECGLTLQRQKTEIFAWGELPVNTPPKLKMAGMIVDGEFQPGFDCYGIPLGTDSYVSQALWEKAAEVKRDMKQVAEILSEDSQALWVALHRSLAHKMDYHLSLCYPSDIKPVAVYLDEVLWSVFERVVGQHMPWVEEGLGIECVLDMPVDSMVGCSFQELFTRLPIRIRGFGLRSLVDTAPAAFIGVVEMSLGGEEAEDRWWQFLLESGTQTGQEFGDSWQLLQREGEQCTTYLGKEFEGALAAGPAIMADSRPGGNCRQVVTEQREELKEAVVREALLRHTDQSARPVRAYPQLDKLSTAWKLSLPGVTNGLTTPVFKEVMAQHLCLLSPACQPILGQPVGNRGVMVGPFGDELMTAHLTQDTWRTGHDSLKVTIVNV